MLVCVAAHLVFTTSILLSSLFDHVAALTVPEQPKSEIRSSVVKRQGHATVQQGLDACGTLIAQYNNDGTSQFPARAAYDCLTSVPFNADIARTFLDYVSGTFKFQSNLAYLRDPPRSYQQPAVDVLEALGAIADNIDSGVYVNEYAFEADIQRVIFRMCDLHINVQAGLLWTFTFGSPVGIVSVSSDGLQLPRPFISSDIIGNTGNFTPSPIQSINGQNAIDYLKRYAALHSGNGIEPHTDYNALMYNPLLDIQSYTAVFGLTSPFYPGDKLDITFANGTSLPTMEFQALATFANDVSNIRNGQDFYNTFVTLPPVDLSSDDDGSSTDDTDGTDDTDDESGDDSASSVASDSTATATDSSATPSATDASSTDTSDSTTDDVTDPTINNWNFIYDITAYPIPDVAQPNLGFGGWVTGYFLNATRTGILSIPSFDMNLEALATFSYAIGNFTQRAQQAGMKRIVIDLQQNLGGDMLLAVDAFRHFFPSTDIYGGSRTRSTNEIELLGYALTGYFAPYLQNQSALNSTYAIGLIADPWAVLNLINPDTGRYFQSWDEFRGPVADHGDFFTKPQQYNYSNPMFDSAAVTNEDTDTSGSGNDGNDDSDDGDESPPVQFIPYGYSSGFQAPSPPFAAEDIVLLTDTSCASTCALFVELMHHVAGVKTITVGGMPQPGPIQAVGGTRGAQLYSSYDLDDDISVSSIVNETAAALLPSDRGSLNFTITQITFNVKDQIRQHEDFPLQFEYAAADCRFFWTQASLNNFTELWSRAAAATWDDPSLCVADSTGYAKKDTDMLGPDNECKGYWDEGLTIEQGRAAFQALLNKTASDDTSVIPSMGEYIIGGIGGKIDDGWASQPSSNDGSSCSNCPGGSQCVYSAKCTNGAFDTTTLRDKPQCKQYCIRHGAPCPGGYCNLDAWYCVPGQPCQAVQQGHGWCEPLNTQNNAQFKTCNTAKALSDVKVAIQKDKLQKQTVLNLIRTPGGSTGSHEQS